MVKRRQQAIATMLALSCGLVSGCATAPKSHGQQVTVRPGAAVARKSTQVNRPVVVASGGGVVSEVEPPQMATAVSFAEAQAAESPQQRSLREQMTRRYGGCCGK